MTAPRLALGFALAALMLAAIVLASCINQDGEQPTINRQMIELGVLSGLKAGAEVYVDLPACLEGQDFVHDQCAKSDIASKVRLAIPALGTAIGILTPLVNSDDQAAIDSAIKLAKEAAAGLIEARTGQ